MDCNLEIEFVVQYFLDLLFKFHLSMQNILLHEQGA